MKINIAAGKQVWPDFFCVDAVQHPKANRKLDLIHAFEFTGETLDNPLPLDDGVATEVHAYHFLEHVYAWEAPALVREFARLLGENGKLVLELPNLEKCAKNLMNGQKDQLCMWGMYGDPGHKDVFMCHRWGYTPKTLKNLLINNGFDHITFCSPKTHGRRVQRDMRAEATKC